MIAIHFLYF
jgi:hypothetical protein